MDKKLQFSGLWAVILGGSSGFGFATVEKLALHGMNIAVLYRETSAAEKLLKEKFIKIAASNATTILPYNINALDDPGRASFIKDFAACAGKHSVKLLLHSIARGNLKPLVVSQTTISAVGDLVEADDVYNVLSIEDLQLTAYAMSTSLLDWTRLLLNAELFHGDGRIIGLTSEGAHKYWEGYAAVSMAKASLESLAQYMAVEFSTYGLKTNIIQAGVTETSSLKRIPGSEKLIEMCTKRNPFGRMTKPNDVAGVIYLLCTEESFWINGSIIHVDGGEHCK
ncbi:SDR family oxidoreductase [Mucilaginibacter gotjawali]|uniref:Enoyl-[acyl-carrier-protein] reductase [NADPH] FabL n=2 Tax=Mucilaginibacter gotjawali TaxID=1550579 RepID=A0A0X8X2B0_9SPHI|nr:SDR family oxidoreductase [Mucilaginibacter gotjawali]MBB3054051.1 NAD(P)-dependent dehydrogenase (short-subunit alcohol dehydrogenase family) [Mucilaginibacter gotjawali]BAU54320.1 Enoyl-[acyl-carrier-protein] reductase [NADPH] FabL [Mucilaginibacter gotjawali]